MNNIIFLSQELLAFLKQNNYKESTLAKYERELKVLQKFCESMGFSEYSMEVGNQYAAEIYIDGHYSTHRYFSRGRVIRFLNYYLENGCFSLKIKERKKYDDEIIRFQNEYESYKLSIYNCDLKDNTKHNYAYGVYMFLKYLSNSDLRDINDLSIDLIYSYISTLEPIKIKHMLDGIRSYLKHIDRKDVLERLTSFRVPKKKKIISVLSEDEDIRLQQTLKSPNTDNRDKSIFLLGYRLGIRACDIVNLKLCDIKWEDDCIQFIQSKTNNEVILPLTTEVGNSLFLYITKEREKNGCEFVFLSHYPPFNPLHDHSACYSIVKKILTLANITIDNRFFGIHFLRHNTASSLVRNGVALETISAILGHSNPDSTNVYISTDDNKLCECVLSMADIGLECDYNV